MALNESFLNMVRTTLDPDLQQVWDEEVVRAEAVILAQILRELKDKGPEEKSRPIGGFTRP